MVMRNTPVRDVLKRRMFMTGPQFDRNDPVGIMGSSPQLMQAVMRKSVGGTFRPQLAPMDNTNPLLLNASLGDVGGDAGGQRFTPTQVFPMPVEDDPNITIDGNPINPLAPVVRRNSTGGGPQQEDPPVVGNVIPRLRIPVNPSKDVTGEVTGPKQRPVRSTDLSQASLIKAMEKLIGNKSTEDFIKENRDLLEKYAPIPDKKNMRKQYLTKFFLDMAARGAQGDKPLAAAATAAPGTFDEYLAAEEKQKDRLAERDLLTVSMGIADKKVQDASAQAINLKLLELAADQPEKMKQVKALMEMGLSETDALARVFPEATGGSTQFIYDQYRKSGHSHRLATIMAGNRDAFTKALTNKSFFKGLFGDPSLTRVDIELLVGYALNSATPEEINSALEVGGHTYRVPPSQPDPQS